MTILGIRRAGERAVVLDVAGVPASVAAGVRTLAGRSGLALTDVVPGAATVLVSAADARALARFLKELPELVTAAEPTSTAGSVVDLPVRYDGPDLDAVARTSGLSVPEVIRRHSAATYLAAFTGFAPGFAYLTGLDPALRVSRRGTPRPVVPPGSVAIADAYSAVYPRRSPGGWQLLGTTDATIFAVDRTPPALIAPGARVRFRPV